MKKCLLKNANLTGIAKFLNENFKKQNNQKFSCRDVLGYIKRGSLPIYIGNYNITEVKLENCSIKLYNIEQDENSK